MITSVFEQKNTELGRRCLALIRDIADRGAMWWDPELIGYALQELNERLGSRFQRGSLPISLN